MRSRVRSIYDGLECGHCRLVITGTSEDDDSLMLEHHRRAHPGCTEHVVDVVEAVFGVMDLLDHLTEGVGPLSPKRGNDGRLLN